jgi:hypothetical protein
MTSREAALRRAIILPPDLYADLEKLARRAGFASVQTWLVVELQRRADADLDCLRHLRKPALAP